MQFVEARRDVVGNSPGEGLPTFDVYKFHASTCPNGGEIVLSEERRDANAAV